MQLRVSCHQLKIVYLLDVSCKTYSRYTEVKEKGIKVYELKKSQRRTAREEGEKGITTTTTKKTKQKITDEVTIVKQLPINNHFKQKWTKFSKQQRVTEQIKK